MRSVRHVAPVLCIALSCIQSACADERSASLVDAFQSVCMADVPNFARLDARAAEENLAVKMEAGIPRRNGPFNHIKTWSVASPTGTYDLTAAEAGGPAGLVTSCTISASDGAGEETRENLMQALKLGPPEREASSNGSRRSAWRVQIHSESMILLFLDMTPSNASGVELNVTYRVAAGS